MKIRTALTFARVCRADLLENSLEALEWSQDEVAFDIKPFEIMTLKFQRA